MKILYDEITGYINPYLDPKFKRKETKCINTWG
jgi:hypothetical protein